MLFNGNYPCDAGLYLRLSREDGDKIESDSIRKLEKHIMDAGMSSPPKEL